MILKVIPHLILKKAHLVTDSQQTITRALTIFGLLK